MVIDSMFVYNFVNHGLRVEIIFRKERIAENVESIVKWYSRKSR